MIIKMSPNFKPEREYIVNVLLNQFLGLSYKIVYSEFCTDYVIELNNTNKLIIKDEFFKIQDEKEGYLKLENIPMSIEYVSNSFIAERDIPIIYGTDKCLVADKEIICGIDIFASSFFMLTRWEEYVNDKRDMHNRFPATESLAYKFGFLTRPVVNEYVEMLWNMLTYLGIDQERKRRSFQLILTHDVDHVNYYKGSFQLLKHIGGDVIKRKNIKLALNRLPEYLLVKLNKKKDPYDTFNWIMDISESNNIQSRFYFMSDGTTKYDNNYKINSKRIQQIVAEIKSRGHIIGFHPSYSTYNDYQQWKYEKELLENIVEGKVIEGRQHYLRFEAPLTWQIWEENNMEMDCTLGYADQVGFRCGTCYEFTVFNFLTRKHLMLKEYPLIVMEGTLVTYQKVSPKKMLQITKELITTVKKYNGNFVFLWHNSSFNHYSWLKYKDIYKRILEIIKMQNK